MLYVRRQIEVFTSWYHVLDSAFVFLLVESGSLRGSILDAMNGHAIEVAQMQRSVPSEQVHKTRSTYLRRHRLSSAAEGISEAW